MQPPSPRQAVPFGHRFEQGDVVMCKTDADRDHSSGSKKAPGMKKRRSNTVHYAIVMDVEEGNVPGCGQMLHVARTTSAVQDVYGRWRRPEGMRSNWMAIATPLGTPEHNGVQPIYMTGKPAYVDVSGTHLVEVVYDNKNAMSLGGHLTIDAGNFYRLQSLVRTYMSNCATGMRVQTKTRQPFHGENRAPAYGNVRWRESFQGRDNSLSLSAWVHVEPKRYPPLRQLVLRAYEGTTSSRQAPSYPIGSYVRVEV